MAMGKLLWLTLLAASAAASEPVKPTLGNPWPYPASFTSPGRFSHHRVHYLKIQPTNFSFVMLNHVDCEVAKLALDRYKEILWKGLGKRHLEYYSPSDVSGNLSPLDIYISSPICHTYPHPFINESYSMIISKEQAKLTAETVWGVLRGLETFVQLTFGCGRQDYVLVREAVIEDYPRFSHRGLLIDTSRHYLPVHIILTMIRALEMNKMNVLHWHVVDDESFPFQSKTFPALSTMGAYDAATMVYTRKDIEEIIEYARLRGVRIVPEFDTPGHTRSWGLGMPDLITECFPLSWDRGITQKGPIDPSRQSNYETLGRLFKEINSYFIDPYIHLGGDEVDHTCWATNPYVQRFMRSMNMTRTVELEDYHMKKMLAIADVLNFSTIVWQEPFERGVHLPKSTIVQVWLGDYERLLKKVTRAGYKAILSACWYLDHVQQDLYGGGGDWMRFYSCNPSWDGATQADEEMIAGGEACMWGEYVDETNVLQRVWPRASAAAERLWSARLGPNPRPELAAPRLEEHTCRMRSRGIPAQPPNGPGFCLP